MKPAWTLELSHADHYASISPMRGTTAPYRLQVLHPNGQASAAIWIPTMERAIESFWTSTALQGNPVPVEVRTEWIALAHKYDEPEGRYIQ